jgi:hypothetical protein
MMLTYRREATPVKQRRLYKQSLPISRSFAWLTPRPEPSSVRPIRVASRRLTPQANNCYFVQNILAS